MRALRSVDGGCLAGGTPPLSEEGLEAGLPPPSTGGFPESLCKGNTEPWPRTSLWDPGKGDFPVLQRDGK